MARAALGKPLPEAVLCQQIIPKVRLAAPSLRQFGQREGRSPRNRRFSIELTCKAEWSASCYRLPVQYDTIIGFGGSQNRSGSRTNLHGLTVNAADQESAESVPSDTGDSSGRRKTRLYPPKPRTE